MNKYVKLLEEDLKLERERVKRLEARIERMELHAQNPVQAIPATGTGFYASTPSRPEFSRINVPARKSFADLKHDWNSLSEEQQEKIVQEGKWEVSDAGQ